MAEKSPTVSIIIPTFNRGSLLKRSIQSVLFQTFQDFELIIVDDASTDDTEKIVKSFNNEKIIYLKNDENKGGAVSRNIGIKSAKGLFIAFQDSDDEWVQEKLEKQIKILREAPSNVGVVYTGFFRIKDNKKTYIPGKNIKKLEGDIFKSILKGNFVSTQTVVIKKDCFNKVGIFDDKLPRLQDWELIIRISKYYHFKIINEPLVLVYYQPISISADNSALTISLNLIYQKHFDVFIKNKIALSMLYFHLGKSFYSSGNLADGKRHVLLAIKAFPLNVKALAVMIIGYDASNKIFSLYKKRLSR